MIIAEVNIAVPSHEHDVRLRPRPRGLGHPRPLPALLLRGSLPWGVLRAVGTVITPSRDRGGVREVSIAHGSTEASVDLLGAHVSALSIGGISVVKPSRDGRQTHGGIAVLIPYAGRVRGGEYAFGGETFRLPTGKDGNAIHGFAKDARWKLERKESGSVLLGAVLRGKGYPGVLGAKIRYSAGPRSFSTTCSLTNLGRSPCPVVVGFHPYFLAHDWRIAAPSVAYRYRLRGLFPTGAGAPYHMRRAGPKAELDDCFRATGTLELLTERYRLRMARRLMPYLVIYNGEYAEGESVAVEPYTGLPDAYNNGIGLRSLNPGQGFSCGYGLTADPL